MSGRILLVLVLAAPLLVACGRGNPPGLQVAAELYPLQYVAERIGGSDVPVRNLTPPGREPHDLELSVKQIGELSQTDLVVYERGLATQVDDAVDTANPPAVVDAATIVHLQPSAAGSDTAEESATDPHFWLDPSLLSNVATAVEQAMAKADPTHASTYAANLGSLQKDLAALDSEFRAGLANCRINTVVVSHDAFEYLGRRYGLGVEPINGLSPDAEPSPQHLEQLHKLVAADHITTLFNERIAPALANTLAHDLGIRTAVLDPIEGLTDTTAHDDYLALMRDNLAALRKANDCS